MDMFLVYFFFSSRRRHTRLQGDWSSDVCSSDLHWAGRGVRVNTLSPGGVLAGQDDRFKDKYSARVPLGRMAVEDDLKGPQIGRASCRERGGGWGGEGDGKKKVEESYGDSASREV